MEVHGELKVLGGLGLARVWLLSMRLPILGCWVDRVGAWDKR